MYQHYECYDLKPAAAWLRSHTLKTGVPAIDSELLEMPLELVGSRSGKLLNDRGYPLFDPKRSYKIGLPGEDGIVEVASYVSEDGPEEDGFGITTGGFWTKN